MMGLSPTGNCLFSGLCSMDIYPLTGKKQYIETDLFIEFPKIQFYTFVRVYVEYVTILKTECFKFFGYNCNV